jgi:lactate 2-monooxygenase
MVQSLMIGGLTPIFSRYNPFLRPDKVGVAIGFSGPIFRARFHDKHGKEIEDDMGTAAAEWTRTVFPTASHSWEDVKFLQKHWDGPIILKGIQNVEDALKCVELGVSLSQRFSPANDDRPSLTNLDSL